MTLRTQGLIEFPGNPFNFPDCEVRTGEFQPFIDPIEAKSTLTSCYNPFRENIITCKDPERDEFVREVGGLTLDLPLHTKLDSIPDYIPIVDTRSIQIIGRNKNIPVMGITLSDITKNLVFKKAGRLHVNDKIEFRKNLLAGELRGKRVIVFLTGSDSLIETVWNKKDESRFFDVLKSMGFWAVGAFNFSVIGGECAFAQVLNLKRSLYSAHLLEKNGLTAIPHIYAISDQQIERWVKWLHANPAVTHFTMNCQLQKSPGDVLQIIHAIETILRQVPEVHAILQGFHFNNIKAFGALLARIHFAEAKPIKNAQSHLKIVSSSIENKKRLTYNSGWPMEELMMENIIHRRNKIAEIKSEFVR